MEVVGSSGASAKVRVVRCPKCDKLLPELPMFTVYRCGSCGAALQAKQENKLASSLDEHGMKTCEIQNFNDSPDKIAVVSNERSLESSSSSDQVETQIDKCLDSNGGLVECSGTTLDDDTGSKEPDHTNKKQFLHPSNDPAANSQPTMPAFVVQRTGDGFRTKNLIAHGSNWPRQIRHSEGVERVKGSALNRALRSRSCSEGIGRTPYLDEGPFNYSYTNSRHRDRAAGHVRKFTVDAFGHLEEDREELMSKLDLLNGHLMKSYDVAKNPNGRHSTSRLASTTTSEHQWRRNWSRKGSSLLKHASAQHSSFQIRYNMEVPTIFSASHSNHEVPRSSLSYIPGRDAFDHPTLYPRSRHDDNLYEHFGPNKFVSYHHNHFDPQLARSFVHCYDKHCPVPSQAPPTILGYQRVPVDINSYHVDFPVASSSAFAHQSDTRTVDNYRCSREPRSSQKNGLNRRKSRSLQPVAGAAPLVLCSSCLNLLQIPPKLKHNLQCGLCSQVMLFSLDGKRLVTSVPSPMFSATSEVNNDPADSMKGHRQGISISSLVSDSVHYGGPINDQLSTEEKPALSPNLYISSDGTLKSKIDMISSEVGKTLDPLAHSSIYVNVERSGSVIHSEDMRCSIEIPLEQEIVLIEEGLPNLQSNHAINRSGNASRRERYEHENVLINCNFKQNSIKDVQVGHEMNANVVDAQYPNYAISHNFFDTNSNGVQPRAGKGIESFLTVLKNKSFKDFPRYILAENEKFKVSINGHRISDVLVKKAEKQAGEIHPGDYWYDYRAGFWGVMGYPCLGIIPPFIEEFNYPIPKKCAGGNTGILVNERELHNRDLDLLVARGLPTTRGKSYMVDISGKVWDEETGEELDSLGKLAPTVIQIRRGFGMRVPKAIRKV